MALPVSGIPVAPRGPVEKMPVLPGQAMEAVPPAVNQGHRKRDDHQKKLEL